MVENITVRTADMIAGEIMAIKEQTGKILLVSAVAIGRRLAEAKEIISYGEFGKWLAGAVDYSESTAYTLMRLAEEYGPGLSAFADAGTQTAPFARLGYSQAVTLLGIPAEERAEFIANLDIENMSVGALKQAVEDRNKAREERAALEKDLDVHKNKISQLTRERDEAKNEAEDKQKAVWKEQGKVTKLTRELNTLKDESATGRRIKEIERERDIARINQSMAQADARYDLIAKGLDDLFNTVRELAATDAETFRHYKKQMNDLLTHMTNRLKRLKPPKPAASAEPDAPETPERPAPKEP